MDSENRIKRLRFRSWHRGTKEADLLIGGFFDAAHGGWGADEIDLFEALIEEQDVDIMAWAIGTEACPARYAGTVMGALKALDYVPTFSLPLRGRAENPAERPACGTAPLSAGGERKE